MKRPLPGLGGEMPTVNPVKTEGVETPATERPARGWFNRFLVLEQDDLHMQIENDGKVIAPGEHDDVNTFPSKDRAETFAIVAMRKHTPEVRSIVIWLGAFPEEDRR